MHLSDAAESVLSDETIVRFSSIHRSPHATERPTCVSFGARAGSRFQGGGFAGQWALLMTLLVSMIAPRGGSDRLAAQVPPGTRPPAEVFEDAGGEKVSIDAFMFRTEFGTNVLIPDMTYERVQQLSNLDQGLDADRQSFGYQSLEITGSTVQERAELEVTIRLTVEPTDGQWIAVPLRMENFHRLAPPDVSGVDEYYPALASDDRGNLLFVKADRPSDVTVRMRVAARVKTNSTTNTLDFRLPDVPSTVELTTDSKGVSGEIFGRGDEAITTSRQSGMPTKFLINSGGGNFTLRWGKLTQSADDEPLLGVDSSLSLVWDSPDIPPSVAVNLSIKSLRGPVSSFRLRLPEGSHVRNEVRLGNSGPVIVLSEVSDTQEELGEIWEVVVPQEERQERVELTFELQLAGETVSASTPLGFRAPEVIGALFHRGDVRIETEGDYRLRWRPTSWIRSTLGQERDNADSGRIYRFRFDRTSVGLPELQLWLGEKEQQVRINTETRIDVRESLANLEMTIGVGGQTTGRLRIDDADWQINAIENVDTGELLDSSRERIIEVDSSSKGIAPIRVRAVRSLNSFEEQVEFALPMVSAPDELEIVQSAELEIVNRGRAFLVVNVSESEGLTPVATPYPESDSQSLVANFRLVSPDRPAIVRGRMTQQLPRIVLESNATVELDGDELRTTVDWNVSSRFDLEGRLPIRIPQLRVPPTDAESASPDGDVVESSSPEPMDPFGGNTPFEAEPWRVTIDNAPATLMAVRDDSYELISDRLSSGTMKIRWRRSQSLRTNNPAGAIEYVSVPRPNLDDVDVRGSMRITLEGNQQYELIAVDATAETTFELSRLPRDPIQLRLKSLAATGEDRAVSIRKTILRTAVGHNERHEQLLAVIQGGDQFRVSLPIDARNVFVQAFIDNEEVTNVRSDENALVVALPGDRLPHVIDLRVWVAMNTPSSMATIRPTLQLPMGTGPVWWQIVAPRDGHVVWASPTMGRQMAWRFDGWRLFRDPQYDDQDLIEMVGSMDTTMPPGNPYLYAGSDVKSFQVVVFSRTMLWILIGSFILVSAIVLTYVPVTRHPLTAVAAAVAFGGLTVIAPDAAVLAGQLAVIASVLVIVMFAVRVLVAPRRGDRVFRSSRRVSDMAQPSTQTQKKKSIPEAAGVATTQPLPPPSPTEASS